ncbi:glycosyltransferase [Flavisericum labens]|uniref:glycosyltransferase n=1 Tax=Flavisericum labens TaxID=3377112 RepID=UPI00387AAAB8
MIKGVSIILCTYNGESRLKTTLKHLTFQKHNIPCELIVVDNASVDGTKEFADSWWRKNGPKNILYRSFSQPVPGKSYAQDLGYKKANYEYLLVCDDDNWLCDTYVQTAFEVMESNSNIGALGGWCNPAFESEKPDWFDTYSRFYAVSKQGIVSGDITNKKGCLYGAGMVIRKSHWQELKTLGFQHLLTCRKGTSLSSGGDTEYSYALRLLGYKIWFDERLHFKHFMTKPRLSLGYLSRLRKAMAYSNFILWPYLDLLCDDKTNFKTHLKLARRDIPRNPIKQFKLLITGTFEQKELVKFYYRNVYYIVTQFSKYKASKAFIKSWLTNKNQ